MMVRIAFGAAVAATALASAMASPMDADEARRFVSDKVFSFKCFDGTNGTGAFLDKGGLFGEVKFPERDTLQKVRLPDRTIQVRDRSVCATLKGLPFEPCFKLDRKDSGNFRGSVSGIEFMYCDFRHEPDLMVVPHRPQPDQDKPAPGRPAAAE